MSARILSGTEAADALLEELRPLVKKLDPKLVIVQVGDDAASASYIQRKLKACERIGMRNEHRHLSAKTTEKELLACIAELNADEDVSGYIVQLPLPEHLWKHMPQITKSIDPHKDADGFTAYNIGKTFLSRDFEHLPPATPSGIVSLLEHYKIELKGKHVVIVGRSNIVGKPLAVMLLNRDATVTICHSKTQDLASITRQADILISAVGKQKLITKDMLRDGAVVIDVGMTRTDEGLTGDVDFENVQKIASAITPMPGGVGPMTVASLLKNCVYAKKRQLERE